MAVTARQIIRRRNDAIIRAWIENPLIQIMVEQIDVLPRLVFLDTKGEGAEAGEMGRRSARNVAMVSQPGAPDANASVWVRSRYASYRTAFESFLESAYANELDAVDLDGFDVDHLMNRARSPADSVFIRVEAVPSEINQAWGRTFEKAASDTVFWANQHRNRRTMSYMVAAKLGGQMPPMGPGDSAGLKRLEIFFRRYGLSSQETLSGLQSMLDFSYQVR